MSERSPRQRRRLTATVTDLEVRRQRAFLVGVQHQGQTGEEAERSLDELSLLTETAGSDPIDRELVRRSRPDPATYIGRGKLESLVALSAAQDVDLVVFDNELTPAQQRNLQKAFGCDVVDREALILDIFAQHAHSREGATQVELALLRYRLPRLRGKGNQLSQQGAGIGTRGPGETKLETDLRRIRHRISVLERQMVEMDKSRQTQRKARRSAHLPQVALVGYTNAGKSTLINRLTGAEVLTDNRLFSTLDPTVRRTALPDGRFVLLSDTVGFVRRLPHQLVQAFRSTLQEVCDADLLLHLVDATDPDPEGQIAAVREVLSEIEAERIPEALAFNKTDEADPIAIHRLLNLHPQATAISALTGEGLDQLLARLAETLDSDRVPVRLAIPYDRGDLLAELHRTAEVLVEKHDEAGTVVEARVPRSALVGLAPYLSA